MRKFLFVLTFGIISIAVFAQERKSLREIPAGYPSSAVFTPLSIAPDFTLTFTDGSSANLYETLDSGNSVVMDFFYVNCYWCQVYAPIIDSAYQEHGAGAGKIKFWGIDYGDNTTDVIAYKAQYDVTNPCASGLQGGGDSVCGLYMVSGYPRYSVVCPDKTYFDDVNYPPTVTGFNAYFDTCKVNSVEENLYPLQTLITLIYPLPAQEKVNVHIFVDNYSQIQFELYDIIGNCVYTVSSIVNKGYYNLSVPVSVLADGTYIAKVIRDEHVKDVKKIIVMK